MHERAQRLSLLCPPRAAALGFQIKDRGVHLFAGLPAAEQVCDRAVEGGSFGGGHWKSAATRQGAFALKGRGYGFQPFKVSGEQLSAMPVEEVRNS